MQIKTFKPEDHKIKALIYGASGSGKTVFAGSANDAIYASAEGGLLSIADRSPKFVEIKKLTDLQELYSFLSTQKHKYRTLVIDSITEINDIIKMEIEKRIGRAMQIQDWGELSKKIRALFRSFRDLPMHVIFVAQEQYINDEDKIKKIVPSMSGKAATEIAYFMDIVGYINVEGDGTRWIETDSNKKLLTKDRSKKIGNDCPLDFTEWEKRVATIKTGKQKIEKEYEIQKEEQSASEEPTERPHLMDLQIQLGKMGAKTKEEALKILNKNTGKKYKNLDITEDQASEALILILQVKQ